MDATQQQNCTPTTDQAPPKTKKTSMVTPAHKGPRRLAFRIRRREFTFEGSPSLLISDRHGVWSVTHRRYIRCTRHHRFYWDDMPGEDRACVVRLYRDLRRRQHRRRIACLAGALSCVAAVAFVLLRLVLMGRCGGMMSLLLDASCLVMAYLLATLLDLAWRGMPGTLACRM